MRKRIEYFDGLKAAACLGVLLTHFAGAFRNYQLHGSVYWINDNILRILLDGDFQIGIFACISGWLLMMKGIGSVKETLKEAAKRYLRFLIPVFFVCLAVFIIDKTAGFHNGEAGGMLSNGWFASYYQKSFTAADVIMSPLIRIWIFADDSFNGPFWMLSQLLFASFIVILISFAVNRLKRWGYLSFIPAFILSYHIGYAALACVLGAFFCLAGKHIKEGIWSDVVFSLIMVITVSMFYGLYEKLLIKILPKVYISTGGNMSGYFKAVSGAVFVLSVSNIRFMKKALSVKPVSMGGKYSFGIYCFHWPVICSFSSMLFLRLYGSMDYTGLYFLLLTFTLLLTAAFAYLFSFAERWSASAVKLLFREKKKIPEDQK